MNFKKRWLYYLISGIALIFFLGIFLGRRYMQSTFPHLSGELKVSALKERASVVRDNWGVPHIRAQNAQDAYFVYGYTLAQDRLFQMELQRRFARGELSEILGPMALNYDKLHRTLLFRATAEKYLKEQGAKPNEALGLLEAFLAGVNYFIENDALPFEFALLGIKPKKFERLDCLAMAGYMSYSFAHGMRTDSLFSKWKKSLPGYPITELFPDYRKGRDQSIQEMDTRVKISQWKPEIKGAEPALNETAVREKSVGLGSPWSIFIQRGDLKALLENIFPRFLGSNSWVLGPARSASGKTILANDPHMAFTNPGIWYEAHIQYPGYENYGFHLPLVPFALLGHNQDKAWALTMFNNDDMDLYYEKINPQDKNQVLYKGKWRQLKIIHETIKIKGGADEKIEVRITPHGPLVNEIMDSKEKQPVSLWWIFHHERNPIMEAFYLIGLAKNPREFEKGVSLIAAPGLNFSYADKAGNIGWWAAAKLPLRPVHVNSKEILDGSLGRDDILGYLPFQQNPKSINPRSGIIITANNKSTFRPVGRIKNLEGYWESPDRANRINEILKSKVKWSLAELKSVQTDLKFSQAPGIVAHIQRAVKSNREKIGTISHYENRALEELAKWDYRANIESRGAAIYYFTVYYILRRVLEDKVSPEDWKKYIMLPYHWDFLKNLLDNESSLFWDNRHTPSRETRDEVIFHSFRLATAELIKFLGENISSWQWGKLHTVEYVHPLGMQKPLNLYFNIGPFPCPGEAFVINRLRSEAQEGGLKVLSGPSTRRLIDYGNPNDALAILPTGNSGNVLSPHYQDQARMFLEGKYRKMYLTPGDIEKNQEHKLEFIPGN